MPHFHSVTETVLPASWRALVVVVQHGLVPFLALEYGPSLRTGAQLQGLLGISWSSKEAATVPTAILTALVADRPKRLSVKPCDPARKTLDVLHLVCADACAEARSSPARTTHTCWRTLYPLRGRGHNPAVALSSPVHRACKAAKIRPARLSNFSDQSGVM